ncbi:hypothetical protein [Macrococcoides caseolyticum]|uniref:Uncharacterized protein n=1 Tax=Macrococcus caseolyticus (strain JCSC5402) TaxID=458233 RepID=B9E7S0_MACCJ|nr:hypothetical protein [Macrococcus caseolyticus]BAH18238.1 hypothetical protein MCCL_1531 [Macrococcus caseolyticus JCSC5402]
MIKIGDKVKFKKYDETIYTVVNVEEEHVRVINSTGTQLMQVRKDFIDVVEQYIDYKQRTDELEKRWSKLVDVLNKKYEYYKVRADDESAGPIEQGKWKIAKLELMMVLMTMAELQEDDND